MSNLKNHVSGILLMLVCSYSLKAQTNHSYAGEVKKMVAIAKECHNMAYQFSLKAEFPNGQEDRAVGEVYAGDKDKIMYNSNTAFVMLYTDKWYYKADHRDKTVTIVNLTKHLNKDYKKGIESDYFSGNMLNYYLDSIIVRFANVKSLKKSDDVVTLDMTFIEQFPIKEMTVEYDEKNRLLKSYYSKAFQKWATNEFGKNKGTTKILICKDFRKVTNSKGYTPEDFFALQKQKVVLKKYKNYKLSTQL